MLIYTTDDDPMHNNVIQSNLKQIFRQSGKELELKACFNGKELLRELQVKVPDCLFLDINMPEMDGLTTLIKVRASNSRIPIIMASSENIDNITRHVGGQTRGEEKSEFEKTN